MEIPASVMSLKKLLKNSSFDLTFHAPCLELKMKWLYGMSLGNSNFGNITLPCTYVKLMQLSRKQGKRMKQCAACPVLLLSDTPEDTCKCQTHENLFLKLEAMFHSYDNSFWNEVLCDTSENSNCWLSECDECREGKKFIPKKQMDSLTICKQ